MYWQGHVDSVMVVVVANELGWPRNESVVLPVATRSVSVTDADGFGMAAELLEDGTTAEPMLRCLPPPQAHR